jgi:hypothetical protein
MATPAQVAANRLNAQKSTGPRTAQGKTAVSQNALKHGLRAEQTVIQGEDPGEFEFYRDRMLAELSPAGAMESTLAQRVVGLAWRLRRAERIQAEVFDALLAHDDSPLAKFTRSVQARAFAGDHNADAEAPTALGRAVVRDFANTRVLERLTMYERRIEHSMYRTMAELQRLRLLRQLDPPPQKQAPSPSDQPVRQTNPISPDINTETPAQRPTTPDKARSSLTRAAGSTIISPSAQADKPSPTVPTRAGSFDDGPLGRKTTPNSPDTGPRRGRGRQLEGLRRR